MNNHVLISVLAAGSRDCLRARAVSARRIAAPDANADREASEMEWLAALRPTLLLLELVRCRKAMAVPLQASTRGADIVCREDSRRKRGPP